MRSAFAVLRSDLRSVLRSVFAVLRGVLRGVLRRVLHSAGRRAHAAHVEPLCLIYTAAPRKMKGLSSGHGAWA